MKRPFAPYCNSPWSHMPMEGTIAKRRKEGYEEADASAGSKMRWLPYATTSTKTQLHSDGWWLPSRCVWALRRSLCFKTSVAWRQRKQSKCRVGQLRRCCKLGCVKRLLPHCQQRATRNQTKRPSVKEEADVSAKEIRAAQVDG